MSTSPVSIAARRSMPVPISGASVLRRGTAWRCMFEPISARLASSCSRNGISAVATDQIWSGETSIRSTSSGAASVSSPPSRERHVTPSLLRRPLSSSSTLAWAIVCASSWLASSQTTSSVTTPSLTTQYGVVTNPCSDTCAYDASALAREAARAERAQAAAVGQARQRVRLVHELRELRGTEELLERRDDRPDVDDRLRGDRVGVLGREALAHHALHAVEADAEGLLDQLSDRAQASVAEVLVLVEALGDRLVGQRGRLEGEVLDR